MRRIAWFALAAALLFAVAGCSDDESSDSVSTTTAAPQGFEVMTDDGQVSLSLDGELPPGWPDSFPVPDGADPAGSGSLGGSESTGLIAVYSTSESAEDTYDFYATNTDLEIESKASLGNGDSFVGTVKVGAPDPAVVTVVPGDGETLIIIALESAGSGTTAPSTSDTAAT
jgi:hypothetical protein